jgi:hypothetical protein
MRSISTAKRGLLHIETPLGIVNIQTGLSDAQGREVVSVEIIRDKFIGEEAELDGYALNRLIKISEVAK